MVDQYWREIADVENDIENAMQISAILLKLKGYDDDLEKIDTNEGNISSNLGKINDNTSHITNNFKKLDNVTNFISKSENILKRNILFKNKYLNLIKKITFLLFLKKK